MNRLFLLSCLAAALVATSSAQAAESPCKGEAPAVGSTLRAPILHVLDGKAICVALGFQPTRWAELDLADSPPDATRSLLMAVAFAQDVDCTILRAGRIRPVAICSIEGKSLGELAMDPAARERAGAWR